MSTSSDSIPSQDRVWLALRFGWTLAEVYGRLAEKPPPDTPSSSTRLFLSDLNPSPNERLWVATQRLIYLTRELFPSEEGEDRGDDHLSERVLGPGPSDYPACVDGLLGDLEARMPGGGKLPRSEDFFADLNPWSRRVWAVLDAEDPLLAEAATLGARLADTYWGWPFPTAQPPPSCKQTWEHMLKSQRMNQIIRHVRPVEGHLPAHVGSVLRHSLWEWGIVGELTRNDSRELAIAYPFLYGLRSLGWARAERRRRMQAVSHTSLELTLDEQRALWKRLRNQMVTWEHLVFNRPLAHLLRPSDWRQIRWLTLALYAGAILLITVGGALLIAWLIQFLSRFLGLLLPFLTTPTEFKDQLTLITTLVAVLAFLVSQFRRGLGQLRHLYDSIYHWVMMRKIDQRGLRAWDGGTKPLRWVWLQRLLRAEDA